MTEILLIVLPVFVIVGLGYTASLLKLLSDGDLDSILRFCTQLGVPCLLFSGVVTLDIGRHFDWRLLFSFYAGAVAAFALGYVGARVIFKRRPGEAVAVAFCALFSNSLLLGLPVTERAYGVEALGPNYVILAVHAPFCYLVGIVAMELARADGRPPLDTARAATRAMFRNALTIGIALGLAINLSGLPLPAWAAEGISTLGRGSIPVALFALGGALTRYSLRAGLGESLMIAALALGLHPLVAWLLGDPVFGLPAEFLHSSIVTAAMPPGINAFIFATMYQRAVGVAASAVLLTTILSVFTATGWLTLLHVVAP